MPPDFRRIFSGPFERFSIAREGDSMGRSIAKGRFEAFLAGLLIMLTSAAHADPIQTSYTVTDLGSSPSNWDLSSYPTFSTTASGVGTVTGPNGQTYPFTQMSGTPLSTPQDGYYMANFPVPIPAPPTNGGPFPNSSTASFRILYPNGIATAIDQVVDHYGLESQRAVPYYVQRNLDGSWGQPIALGQGFGQSGPYAGWDGWASPIGVDKQGDILVRTTGVQGPGDFNYTLYNIYKNTSTNLSTLPAPVNNGFQMVPSAWIDQDGRILLWAYHWLGTGPPSTDLLLLTPAGVSPDPINTPEPGSLAVMALAMAAFAVPRARGRRTAG
jgi:hypothetical protein